jgi:stress response protein YsnF
LDFAMKELPSDSLLASKIPVLEERATVTKQEVTTGKVRVSTHVENIAEVARADLLSDGVEISRINVGLRVMGPIPQVKTEGDLTIVPVFEEVLVVEKHLFLKEEIHIRRRQETESVAVQLTLRRQTVEVERSDGEKR